MIPVLYDPYDIGEGSLPQHLGKGLLTKATECIVTMDENYTFDMTMKIPILTGDSVIPEVYDIVRVDCGLDNPQYFEIQSINKNTNGREREYYAWHISRRMAFETVNAIPQFRVGLSYVSPKAGMDAIVGLLTAGSTGSTNFKFHCEVTSANMQSDYPFFGILEPSPLLSVLTDYANMLGARLEFDNYDVHIRPNLDINSGVRVTSRRNLLELADEIDGTELISGYTPYFVYKSNGVQQIQMYAIARISNSKLPYKRIVPYNLSARYPEQNEGWYPMADVAADMIAQVIRETGTEYVRTMSLNYHEIKGQEIRLYDAIDIYCPEIGIDESRPVVKVTYNVLRERNESIQVGTLQSTLTELVSASSNPREIGTRRTIN